MIRTTLILAVMISFCGHATADIVFTTEGNFDIGSENYLEGDVASYDPLSSPTSALMLSGSSILADLGGNSQRIGAMHFLNGHELVFTADDDFQIGTDPAYTQGQLVRYNITTGSHSLFFDPFSDTDWNGNQEITAAFFTNNNSLIFTTNGNFDFGGSRPTEDYDRGDLVEYDLTTGTTTLFFDRDLITGGNDDITSAHVLPDGSLLFTTRGDTDIGTASFDRGDVILYDFGTGTASLYFDRDNITNGNDRIIALSIVPEPTSLIILFGSASAAMLFFRRRSSAKWAA